MTVYVQQKIANLAASAAAASAAAAWRPVAFRAVDSIGLWHASANKNFCNLSTKLLITPC